MNPLQPEHIKDAFAQIDKSELDLSTTKDILNKVYTSAGQFYFNFQMNDILQKIIQCRRVETAKHFVQAICEISYRLTFDPLQINWNDLFKFLSQVDNLESCLEPVLNMIENKLYLPDNSMNLLAENLIEKRHYEQSLKLLTKLKDHDKIGKLNARSILKTFLVVDQHEIAFQFLQLLPLQSTSTLYVWEDYIQYCCNKDIGNEAREFMKSFFMQTLPAHPSEAETIYSYLLIHLCRAESTKETICDTIDDIIELKLKVKANTLKDALLKLLDQKISQKEFFAKISSVKFNLECREFSALLSRLIQLDRKVEVMALVDMIINETGFSFKMSDLSLSNQDMKFILMAQSLSIRYLLNEKDKENEASRSLNSISPDKMNILDKLNFNDESFDESFERMSSMSNW